MSPPKTCGLTDCRGYTGLLKHGFCKTCSDPGFTSVWRNPKAGVEVFSYPCMSRFQPKTSYEVHLKGESIQRFLYLDHGDINGDLAKAWAAGMCHGMWRAKDEAEKAPKPLAVELDSPEFRKMIETTLRMGRERFPKGWMGDDGVPDVVDTLISSFKLLLDRLRKRSAVLVNDQDASAASATKDSG